MSAKGMDAESEVSRLKTALQKIADLPLEQVGNRSNPRVRARRIVQHERIG